MKKATLEDMELGNLIFGNSYGKYAVEPRKDYQHIFFEFLDANGWDGYAIRNNDEYNFENDVFIIRAYYWGEDEAIAELPNFVFKPLGLEIRWYKYPLRDAYSNKDVSLDAFKAILKVCEFSLKEPKEGKQDG